MAGVWLALAFLTIGVGLPAILGTYLVAQYGSPRLVCIWLTGMVALFTAALGLTAFMMFSS